MTSSAVPRGVRGVSVGIAFTILSLITLLARLFTRFVLVKNPGVEELMIIFAWAFSATHTSLVGVEVLNGLGDHSKNLSLHQGERILLPFWVSVPMYSISLYLTKFAILLLYLRLFRGHHFRQACWWVVAIMSAFLVWTICGFMFMCHPIRYFWIKNIPGSCINSKFVYFTNAPFNILTDFVLFGLPIPVLRKLQMPRRQKISLGILFAVGLLGCLTSILRLRSLYYLSISTDLTYDNLDIAVWSCVEVNVGICCACVPTLKPLVTALVPRLLSDHTSKRSKATPYNMYPPDSDIALSPGSQGCKTYAHFEKDTEIPPPGAIQVRVTTNIALENYSKTTDETSGNESA